MKKKKFKEKGRRQHSRVPCGWPFLFSCLCVCVCVCVWLSSDQLKVARERERETPLKCSFPGPRTDGHFRCIFCVPFSFFFFCFQKRKCRCVQWVVAFLSLFFLFFVFSFQLFGVKCVSIRFFFSSLFLHPSIKIIIGAHDLVMYFFSAACLRSALVLYPALHPHHAWIWSV